MSHIIDFLERMGQDPRWRHASPDELKQALAGAEIAPELRDAILASDAAQLERLLGQVPLCAVYMPGNEEEDEDEEGETPSREPDDAPGHSGRVAEISPA